MLIWLNVPWQNLKERRMSNKQYTQDELLKKFKGKYIYTCPTYDYSKGEWLYEVRGTSKTIRENHNLPEEELIQD
jgi:hypothetical protein